MWELKIEKTENGFILSHKEEIEEEKFEIIKEVIEEGDDEKETMKRLLERVAEYFGVRYDKYAKDNLSIAWDKKGHKI
jgi:transposase